MTDSRSDPDQTILTRLTAARTHLILDRPFLGTLVMRLPLKETDAAWCLTVATDAKAFYYNPEYLCNLKLDEMQFVLAHEALHCALSHFTRRQHRDKRRWDLACDLAINPALVEDGLTPPPGTLLMEGFAGMSAEEIYPYIDENSQQETLDKHLYDEGQGGAEEEKVSASGQGDSYSGGGSGDNTQSGQRKAGGRPAPLTELEKTLLATQWNQRVAGAAQQARQANKLGEGMARLIDELLQPRLPWRNLLAEYMSGIARDDFSYARPSRREGEAILPSLRSSAIDLVVVVDVSGSVSRQEMQEFISEVDAIKGQIRARITLHAVDSQLDTQGPWVFEPWDEIRLPAHFEGHGGTSFIPVFHWVEQQDRHPELLLYFTDAEGPFPPQSPAYPVLWLVKGKSPVPWGRRIQLN
ncbi:MAG: hypothetical protein GXP22_11000 [Gammaproteobacteria bacterium]|nr:hypothetical protein [Gammaproteobacteria bacterium]